MFGIGHSLVLIKGFFKTVLCKFRLCESESCLQIFVFFISYGEEDEREYLDLTLEDIERLNPHCLRWD